MPKRKRRRGQQAYTEGGLRWLSPPIVLAFGLGGVLGSLLALVPAVGVIFFFVAVFMVTLAGSHLLGRRLRARQAARGQPQGAPARPQAPQQSAGDS